MVRNLERGKAFALISISAGLFIRDLRNCGDEVSLFVLEGAVVKFEVLVSQIERRYEIRLRRRARNNVQFAEKVKRQDASAKTGGANCKAGAVVTARIEPASPLGGWNWAGRQVVVLSIIKDRREKPLRIRWWVNPVRICRVGIIWVLVAVINLFEMLV